MPPISLSRFILIALFFFSGFSALIYQVAWQRMLALFAGTDIISITIVVSVFLSGLSLGSWLCSRFADQLQTTRALLIYALIEVVIGLYALATPTLFYDIVFLKLSAHAATNFGVVAICFLFLIIPTTLMGMTLPLLSQVLSTTVANAAAVISRVNGINIMGAAFGALISGWVFIAQFGYKQTVFIGAGFSIFIGIASLLLCLLVRNQLSSNHVTDQHNNTDTNSKGDAPSTLSRLELQKWCFLFFLTGFISISLEFIWFRVLNITLQSSPYTFSYILFWFLAFDALGCLAGFRLIKSRGELLKPFLHIQALIVLYSLTSIYLSGIYIANSTEDFSEKIITPVMYFGIIPFIIAPPAFLIGVCFPVVQKMIQRDIHAVGSRVGLLQFANISGNILASVFTTLVLFEWLGTPGTLMLFGCIGLVIIAYLMIEDRRHGDSILLPSITALLIVTLMSIYPQGKNFWLNFHNIKDYQAAVINERADGVSLLVESSPRQTDMYIHGYNLAGLPFYQVHTLLGAIPALIHEQAQSALIIGFGSGGTPYGMGVNPNIRDITVAELMHGIYPMVFNYIEERKDKLPYTFDRERYRFVEQDGRKLLNISDKKYDLIQADAIIPDLSGSGFLYSKEYFEQAKERLSDNGIMAQWRPTQLVENTFITVFPYVVKVHNVLLGSEQPIRVDIEKLKKQLVSKETLDYLHVKKFDMVHYGKHKLKRQKIRYWKPDTPRKEMPINTDFMPRDEFSRDKLVRDLKALW